MESRVRKEYEAYKTRLITEKSISEDEFERRLTDAGDRMLPPNLDSKHTEVRESKE